MSQYLILPTNQDIQHHGILGMSWGKRNGPPYPLNASGRAALRKQKKQAKKIEKQEAKKQADEKKEKEDREKFIRSASAAEVMKRQGEWTNEELKRIENRLDLEAKIMAKIPKEKTIFDAMNLAAKQAGDLANFGNKAMDLWKVFNRLMGDDKNKSEGKKKNKKKNKGDKVVEEVLKTTSKSDRWKDNFDWDYDWGG